MLVNIGNHWINAECVASVYPTTAGRCGISMQGDPDNVCFNVDLPVETVAELLNAACESQQRTLLVGHVLTGLLAVPDSAERLGRVSRAESISPEVCIARGAIEVADAVLAEMRTSETTPAESAA